MHRGQPPNATGSGLLPSGGPGRRTTLVSVALAAGVGGLLGVAVLSATATTSNDIGPAAPSPAARLPHLPSTADRPGASPLLPGATLEALRSSHRPDAAPRASPAASVVRQKSGPNRSKPAATRAPEPRAAGPAGSSTATLAPPAPIAPLPLNVPPRALTLAEKRAKLFEVAFGGRIGDRIEVVTAPTRINGESGADVSVRARPEDPDAFEVSASMVARALDPFLAEQPRADLAGGLGDREWIDAAALATLGITATFDQAKLEVKLAVPPALAPPIVRGRSGLPEGAASALRPATTSGYLTARARATWRWSGGLDPLPDTYLDLTGALQHRGVVLEGGWVGDTTSQTPSRRNYTRVVYDDPARAIRYTAGDLTVPAVGFHDGLALLGLSAARNFALQPYSAYRPAGRFEFVLEQRAQVQIYVNGVLIDSLDLEPGTHDIRDFPLCQGVNRIRVVIPNGTGQPRELDFSTAVSADLLAPGVHQFSYGLGFRRTDDLAGYVWADPTASLVHRVGLTGTITAQAYGALSPTSQVIGMGPSLATRFGNVSVDVGASHGTGTVVLPAARVRYDLAETQTAAPVIPGLRVGLEYRPAEFGKTTVSDVDAPSMTTTAVGSLMFPRRLRATLEGTHQFGGAVAWRDPWTLVQLGLQGELFHRVSATLSGANVRTQGGRSEWRAGLTLLSNLGTPSHTVRGAVRASSAAPLSEELSWNQALPNIGRGMQNGVSITSSEDGQSVFAHAGVATSRGTFDLSQTMSGKARILDQATSLSVASSVAFADGTWGLSSPIDGSFAVIGRRARMKGQLLDVNLSAARPIARADRLGAAVLPNLQAYTVIPFNVDAPVLPVGYELGPNRFYLLPGYKTGTAIRVGNDASILIRGVLQGSDGAPAAFASGVVVSLSEPDQAPLTMFTNGTGHFFVEGLKPGGYEIRVSGDATSAYGFTLAPDVAGVSTLGAVRLLPRQ